MAEFLRRRIGAPLVAVMVATMPVAACVTETSPYTGREQFLITSEQAEIELGRQAYAEILQREPLSNDPRANAMVNEVGRRIAAVSGRPDLPWEFRVLADDDTVNAFALPGGKVSVYTGMLRLTETPDQLAFVMGHEVAHTLARHAGERISQQTAIDLGLQGVAALWGEGDPAIRDLALQALGLGAELGIALPYSREHEFEADRLGMLLMAEAGYDPREALRFWQKMAETPGPEPLFDWLSTHPDDYDRIAAMQEILPEAMAVYEGQAVGQTVPR